MSEGAHAGWYPVDEWVERWWDGRQWSRATRPRFRAPVATATPAYAVRGVMPVNAKNGPAKAALILLLIQNLGFFVLLAWWSREDPALQALVSVAALLSTFAAFALSIIGLVIAMRRPTRKREAVFGLVLSSLTLAYVAVRVFSAVAAALVSDPALLIVTTSAV